VTPRNLFLNINKTGIAMNRLNIYISGDLHSAFKRACIDVGKSMSTVVEELIDGYVHGHAIGEDCCNNGNYFHLGDVEDNASPDRLDAKLKIAEKAVQWLELDQPAALNILRSISESEGVSHDFLYESFSMPENPHDEHATLKEEINRAVRIIASQFLQNEGCCADKDEVGSILRRIHIRKRQMFDGGDDVEELEAQHAWLMGLARDLKNGDAPDWLRASYLV
jgi:hypothetical protein